MRFPKPALVVGSPVPANAADVASGLGVEWREHHAAGDILVANVEGFGLEAHHNGYWEVVDPLDSSKSTNGHGFTLKDAKYGAVLDVASLLVEQRAKAEHAKEQRAIRDFMAKRYDLNTATDSEGGTDARAALVDALAKSPAPDPVAVAKIVEARRPFSVGDRVRLGVAQWMPRLIAGTTGVVTLVHLQRHVSSPRNLVTLDNEAHTAVMCLDSEIDLVDAAPAFKWEWRGDDFSQRADAPCGKFLRVWGDGGWAIREKSDDIEGEIVGEDHMRGTMATAKAAAEAAYAKATR